MSDTIRRKNVVPFFNLHYLVPNDLKSSSKVDKIAEALFHSDRVDGDSAPKWIRSETNRSERYKVKNDLRLAINTNSFDNFIDSRLHIPYWS